MKYRRLGTTGLRVSAVGLGGNNFGRVCDAEQTARVVHAALDCGINFFDTADSYGGGQSEEFLGRALRGHREEVVIATKVGWELGPGPNERGASRVRILAGIERSLRRLQTDYVDLYQIHRWDPETPLEETLEALHDLVRQGKVRYIGCSNFAAWQLVWSLWLADRHGWARFATVQPEYSLLNRAVERELLPACATLGVGVIPYFPLAGGMLTGKYREEEQAPPGSRFARLEHMRNRFATPRNFAIVRRLEAWARERGYGLAQLAIAWLLHRPAVCTVIAGATRPEQVVENARAAEVQLTPEETEELAALAPLEGA
ncbi:MAG: aldo/keto reductase [Armatimonadota bacterium]|nr:aldo/keto reductase [Armatimonadota bacterium]MDR7440274.1 aldo/keto reductase [Armatimonadota bacterium]MDR7563931.1 aldo/keto reductase [Armatimonadota bacterium]MDR7568175.1 aldo/keto reductase [Armatimonadota bacterium]MDR7602713.1 aldo/keto reductase [Armatimonadota bacterium]